MRRGSCTEQTSLRRSFCVRHGPRSTSEPAITPSRRSGAGGGLKEYCSACLFRAPTGPLSVESAGPPPSLHRQGADHRGILIAIASHQSVTPVNPPPSSKTPWPEAIATSEDGGGSGRARLTLVRVSPCLRLMLGAFPAPRIVAYCTTYSVVDSVGPARPTQVESRRGESMDMIIERVAGLDIGKEEVVAAVRTPGETAKAPPGDPHVSDVHRVAGGAGGLAGRRGGDPGGDGGDRPVLEAGVVCARRTGRLRAASWSTPDMSRSCRAERPTWPTPRGWLSCSSTVFCAPVSCRRRTSVGCGT